MMMRKFISQFSPIATIFTSSSPNSQLIGKDRRDALEMLESRKEFETQMQAQVQEEREHFVQIEANLRKRLAEMWVRNIICKLSQ